MVRLLIVVLLTLLSGSFSAIAKLPLPSPPPVTPQESYEFYYAFSKENDDFEKELMYFSKAKRLSVMAQIDAYVETMGLTREDAVSMFMEASKDVSECGELDFKGEDRSGSSAVLFYIINDACAGGEYIHKVTMVRDRVWRIEEILTLMN